VTFVAAMWVMRLGCFSGQELTLQGWYPELPSDVETSGDCVAQPAWLICGWDHYDLRTIEMAFYDDRSANRIDFKVDPASGVVMPERGQWIEVRGRFDHPIAQSCGGEEEMVEGLNGLRLLCRLEFVVSSVRPLGDQP
jgi:hypothetical protein